MRLRVSARACVRERRTPSISSSINRDTTSRRAFPAASDRSRSSICSSMYCANSGNALANPSPRSVRFRSGNSLSISSFARRATRSASSAGNPSRWTVTRFGSGTVNAATRSALRRAVQPVEEVVGRRAHERLRFVHDRRRQRGDHHAPHERMLRGVELAEDAVLERDDDARCLHSRRVRERRGVAHDRAALRPARHVRQVAGDSGDGAARGAAPGAAATRPGPRRTDRTRTPRSSRHSDKGCDVGVLPAEPGTISASPRKDSRHGRSSRQAHRVPGRQRRRRAGRVDRAVEGRRAGRR